MVYLDCSGVRFGSQLDEKHLFQWAAEIACFVRWEQDTLVVKSRRISEESLRDLLALFWRYNIPMRQLAQFRNSANEAWFAAQITRALALRGNAAEAARYFEMAAAYPDQFYGMLALERLGDVSLFTRSGAVVPLSQVATLEYGFEEGVIWHRNRLPNVTVRADIYGKEQPATLVQQILPTLEPIRAELPDGFLLEVGGTVEDSARGQNSVKAGVPLFIVVVLTLLMIQLRSFSRTAMVFLTAPLGLIGVTLFLLVFRQPFGFVAMLGTIALSGMIMRNSVILVDQIEQDIKAGLAPWQAIIEATVRRFRPIVLTALAAVLAMIPLSRSVFFGPMAVAIMGGLVVATALTLLFLPALYAAWFRVKPTPAE